MSVELTVKLVGDDPQQQEAFNTPAPAPASAPTAPSTPSQPMQPTVAPSPIVPPTAPTPIVPARPLSRDEVLEMQGRAERHATRRAMANALDEVLPPQQQQPNPQQPAQPTPTPQTQPPQNWIATVTAAIDQRIEDMGLSGTAIGNMASRLTHSLTNVVSRAAQFSSAMMGAGGGAAAGAGEAAAGAAAAGAAGGGALAAAGTAALPLAAVAAGAAAVVISFKTLMETVDGLAQELGDLSPDIAAEQAQQQARRELSRLDRSDRIGPQVASLQAANNRISESMYEVQTKIYELLLRFEPIFETSLNLLDSQVKTLDVVVATINSGIALLTFDPDDDKPAADALRKSINALNESTLRLLGADLETVDGYDPVLGAVLNLDGKAGPPPPRRAPPLPPIAGGRP